MRCAVTSPHKCINIDAQKQSDKFDEKIHFIRCRPKITCSRRHSIKCYGCSRNIRNTDHVCKKSDIHKRIVDTFDHDGNIQHGWFNNSYCLLRKSIRNNNIEKFFEFNNDGIDREERWKNSRITLPHVALDQSIVINAASGELLKKNVQFLNCGQVDDFYELKREIIRISDLKDMKIYAPKLDRIDFIRSMISPSRYDYSREDFVKSQEDIFLFVEPSKDNLCDVKFNDDDIGI